MYKIEFSRRFERFLDQLDIKVITKFYKGLEKLYVNPFDRNVGLNIKPIESKKGHYRLRIGRFRFLYEVQKGKNVILFYKGDDRKDVYRDKN